MTPMLRQYRELKSRYRDAILLFRLGDFYEAFFEDAEVAARELAITLTSREMGKGMRAPMAGIPYHAAETYVSRLVERGHRVAICEQVEDPRQARGLVRREVVRVITPGTVSEGRLLEEKGQRWLVAVSAWQRMWAVASLDASTGEFRVTCFRGGDGERAAGEELARLAPVECLLPVSLRDGSGLEEAARGTGALLTPLPEGEFDPVRGRERLLAHFQVGSLTGFGLEGEPAALGAAGAALAYVTRTQGTAAHIRDLRTYHRDDHLVLDSTAVRNLELFRRLGDGSREGTLLWVLDETMTAGGGRRLRSWLERPLLDPVEINRRLDAVEELYGCALGRAELRNILRQICDGERLLARAATGTVTPRELGHLRRALALFPSLQSALREVSSDLLRELREKLEVPAGLQEALAALEEDLPISPREGGIIRSGFSSEVDETRKAARQGRQWLAQLEAEEKERTGIKSLKVGYNQVFGYYLEVTRSNLHLVPPDWTRQQTLAGAERFFTTRLKELESTIRGAEERLIELEYQLFCQLRDRVVEEGDTLRGAFFAVSDLDALTSLAEVASRYGYVRPRITGEEVIVIEEGRHPVLERMVGEGRFVPNGITLSPERRLLVITGPNMAGKSTFMRQVALIVIMAHMGSFVPARQASVRLVDRVFVRVGARDDLASGQSTFMVEMAEVANALRHASPRSLVVLDEIGRGTSTFDGLSIAWAVAEYLHDEVRCQTLLATHYREMIALAEELPAAANCSVTVKRQGDDIVFLRRVVEGGADASYGVEVARLAGLPEVVVERARYLLGQLEEGRRSRRRRASLVSGG
ncbi:MAG TPA: DNA mismatch repair protein MutS, partial [Firmicutes bacterium]|nr:DNA mismatch repair protein MutS [Bacillota bacterium]